MTDTQEGHLEVILDTKMEHKPPECFLLAGNQEPGPRALGSNGHFRVQRCRGCRAGTWSDTHQPPPPTHKGNALTFCMLVLLASDLCCPVQHPRGFPECTGQDPGIVMYSLLSPYTGCARAAGPGDGQDHQRTATGAVLQGCHDRGLPGHPHHCPQWGTHHRHLGAQNAQVSRSRHCQN